MLKVTVDRNICAGHALCQARCPEVYGADELGYCVILMEDVPDSLREQVELGAKSCPEGAIKVAEVK